MILDRVRRLAEAAPIVLSADALEVMSVEVGGHTALFVALREIASDTRRPIGITDGNRSAFIAPAGWSRERLTGYVGGLHREIEAALGPSEIER